MAEISEVLKLLFKRFLRDIARARGHATNLIACDVEHDLLSDHYSVYVSLLLSVRECNESSRRVVVVHLPKELNIVYLSFKLHSIYAKCFPFSLGLIKHYVKYHATDELFPPFLFTIQSRNLLPYSRAMEASTKFVRNLFFFYSISNSLQLRIS